MSLFSCYEPESKQLKFVPCLLQMKPFDRLESKGKISLHGSLIVQQLLQFSKPIRVRVSYF